MLFSKLEECVGVNRLCVILTKMYLSYEVGFWITILLVLIAEFDRVDGVLFSHVDLGWVG